MAAADGPTLEPAVVRRAARELAAADTALAPWITRVGSVALSRRASHFGSLCRSVMSQQLSSRAADTIIGRVLSLCHDRARPRPREVLALDASSLRSAGLSGQKVAYLGNLAAAFADGPFAGYRFSTRTNAAIIEDLTAIKGIGRWTAEMFLIFSLRRPDVFSAGDLALRAGVERLTGQEGLSPASCADLACRWRPWRTVASLYLWRIAHWAD